MLRATLNEAVPLQVLASDGNTALFARALIYRAGALEATVSLLPIAGGLYGLDHTFVQEGYVSVVYQLFFDAGLTVPAPYDLESEIIEVSSDKSNILRILGLLHENAVFDQQVFDVSGNLVSGRIRSYDTKLNAQAAGLTGLLFTWLLSAVYTGGQLSRYSLTREM